MARGEAAHRGRGQRWCFFLISVRLVVLRRRRWTRCKGGSTESVARLFGGGERQERRKFWVRRRWTLFKGAVVWSSGEGFGMGGAPHHRRRCGYGPDRGAGEAGSNPVQFDSKYLKLIQTRFDPNGTFPSSRNLK
jgi:hypothetical protein